MLGIFYLVLATALGFIICSFAFPQLNECTKTTLKGDELGVSTAFVRMPAWFVTGIIVMTWVSYISACIFSNRSLPLLYGDEIAMIISFPIIIFGMFILLKNGRIRIKGDLDCIKWYELVVLGLISLLFMILFRMTFKVDHNQLYVGLTVFSDFTPHISMARSFSNMQNFPTQYSVFAGSDMRYHFMFEFLIGNLEFLGLRIDHAFNLPSLLSIICMFSLLYSLTCRITGKRAAGLISCAFLTFRSSSALFYFLVNVPKGTKLISALTENSLFIGSTNHEDWGLWNLNVYCNQRHLALGICVLLIMLHLFLPLLYSSFERIAEDNEGIKSFFTQSLFSAEGWLVEDWKTPVCSGILLGALGFFNGAVLLVSVMILFFMAAASSRRLEYLIMAAIAGALSFLQTSVFIDGQTFSTSYLYGFLSDNGTLFSSIDFILKLLGVLPVLLIVCFIFEDIVSRYLMICFSVPIVFSFTVSLTPDIAVNHKYIMIAVMLLNIFAASLITRMFEQRKVVTGIVAAGLIITLTATGIYDTYILQKRSNPKYSMVNDLGSELMKWIAENCSANDIFLTSNYYYTNNSSGSQIILSGAMMFDAWQYFAWSAGYDTGARDEIVNRIYSEREPDIARNLLRENNIDYVVIDETNRLSDAYTVNEQMFDENFDIVYSSGSDLYEVKIYKVN